MILDCEIFALKMIVVLLKQRLKHRKPMPADKFHDPGTNMENDKAGK